MATDASVILEFRMSFLKTLISFTVVDLLYWDSLSHMAKTLSKRVFTAT